LGGSIRSGQDDDNDKKELLEGFQFVAFEVSDKGAIGFSDDIQVDKMKRSFPIFKDVDDLD